MEQVRRAAGGMYNPSGGGESTEQSDSHSHSAAGSTPRKPTREGERRWLWEQQRVNTPDSDRGDTKEAWTTTPGGRTEERQ